MQKTNEQLDVKDHVFFLEIECNANNGVLWEISFTLETILGQNIQMYSFLYFLHRQLCGRFVRIQNNLDGFCESMRILCKNPGYSVKIDSYILISIHLFNPFTFCLNRILFNEFLEIKENLHRHKNDVMAS